MGIAGNQDGIEQVIPVLKRNGFEEIHIAHMQTIMDSIEAAGEFHIDMVIGVLDIRKAVVYPASLDYETYKWLKDHRFELVEIPPDEHKQFVPANLVTLEPGRVIMPAGAERTIRAVKKLGVDVIEIETVELLKGGTNGLSCTTLALARDRGPSLKD
jgi:N-dimethylarginine dimethylaminohydrolase